MTTIHTIYNIDELIDFYHFYQEIGSKKKISIKLPYLKQIQTLYDGDTIIEPPDEYRKPTPELPEEIWIKIHKINHRTMLGEVLDDIKVLRFTLESNRHKPGMNHEGRREYSSYQYLRNKYRAVFEKQREFELKVLKGSNWESIKDNNCRYAMDEDFYLTPPRRLWAFTYSTTFHQNNELQSFNLWCFWRENYWCAYEPYYNTAGYTYRNGSNNILKENVITNADLDALETSTGQIVSADHHFNTYIRRQYEWLDATPICRVVRVDIGQWYNRPRSLLYKLHEMSFKETRQMCKENKISGAGKKLEMVRRLIQMKD